MSEGRQKWNEIIRHKWALIGWLVFLMFQPHPAFAGEVEAASPTKAVVGAIRWDAWFGGGGYGRYLAAAKWHTRLPFYSTIGPDGNVEVRSDSQQVTDQEIAYAAAAGLDYWAFCYYHPASWPEADNYNYGWRLYLSSKRKTDLGFCILLQGQHLGPKEKWTETIQTFVNAGWDNRPRRGNPAFGDLAGPWFTEPSPTELADHLRSAIQWNRANARNAPANAVIIYAWNESDEGGWLVPTRSEGAARLNAITKILRPPVLR